MLCYPASRYYVLYITTLYLISSSTLYVFCVIMPCDDIMPYVLLCHIFYWFITNILRLMAYVLLYLVCYTREGSRRPIKNNSVAQVAGGYRNSPRAHSDKQLPS